MLLDPVENGGVEEKKEDEAISPLSLRNRPSNSTSPDDIDDEQVSGFQAQLHSMAKAILGSCGSALEAASLWMQNHGCRWPGTTQDPAAADMAPPLSIAEELRKLAMQTGAPFAVGTRRTDIPKFLGEDAVYSFEDDNISAISQHTLEEMAQHGMHPRQRRRPPSPTRTISQSSSSKEIV